MTPRDDEIAQYATAVRAALDDLPEADREELVEDLEDHLAEVVAESAEQLTVRLGTPEAYAAELRAAYGADGGRGKRSLGTATLANFDLVGRRLKTELANHRYFRRVWEFIGELRPTWWLLRGYLAALLLWYVWDHVWHVLPWGFGQLVLVITFGVVSAMLGSRARGGQKQRPLKGMLVAANVLAVLGLLFIWSEAGTGVVGVSPANASASPSPDSTSWGVVSGGGDGQAPAANIYPYSKDGKPLKDVLLYDENGRPILLNYEEQGFTLEQLCGKPPPIANSYPLSLKQTEEWEQGPLPTHSCTTASPTPAPHPTPTPSPSPTKTG